MLWSLKFPQVDKEEDWKYRLVPDTGLGLALEIQGLVSRYEGAQIAEAESRQQTVGTCLKLWRDTPISKKTGTQWSERSGMRTTTVIWCYRSRKDRDCQVLLLILEMGTERRKISLDLESSGDF